MMSHGSRTSSRRALRAGREPGTESAGSPDSASLFGSATEPAVGATDATTTTLTATTISPPREISPWVLPWVDAATIATPRPRVTDLSGATVGYLPAAPDLLGRPPRRSPFRAGVLAPIALAMALAGAYAATTLLWPLHAVTPTIEAADVQPIAAAAATPAWPAEGSAAVSVQGIAGTLTSAEEVVSIASITKVVTALVVLDEMPLALGEQGPEYRFTGADNLAYWAYRARGESALDVPVGGTLTQYQLLEGMLIGSANNYADRLANNLWPSDAVFADAATEWLSVHGVPGIRITEPTGIDPSNSASPGALIALAQKALANPVIAEIVAKTSVELPGAGLVENTNELLADPGVIGVKTGTLDAWNLLTAKDVVVDDTSVRLYASILGQPNDEARLAAARALFAQLEAELQVEPSVAAGTQTGVVTTVWGESVPITATSDANVVLWNGGVATVETSYSLGDSRAAGDSVGTLKATGPLDGVSVDLQLAADIEEPTAWWRLTHPLELFGLTD